MATSPSVSSEKDGAAGAPVPAQSAAPASPSSPPAGGSGGGDAREAEGDLPRALGRYMLLRRLARGGMGEVFLGSTMGLEGAERPVVVKIIRREHVKDPSFIARFLDEARVQAQLHHSGVAQVLEASTCEVSGEPYAVIEHVEGKSLGDVRARALQIGHRLGWVDAVAIATMIAEALAHVHERQDAAGRALAIVHRDLSPQNVMLSFAGDVKIIDFGTARGQNRRCRTVSGVVFAKPGYVAPEVANGDSGDARVDIYALGIMLWELCAGRRFLQGDASAHMAGVARNLNHPPAIAASCGAPPELDAIIAKLTAFDRETRYTESRVAACDLAKLLASAPSMSTGERGVRPRAARLMQALFPSEPARSRREFAKLVASSQAQMKAASVPRPASVPPPSAPAKSEPPRSLDAPDPPAAAAREEVASDMLPGTRYRVIREMGRGASSVVYEAEHVDLGRRVALKVLAAEHASVKEFVGRFRREARALSLLSHDGLVKIMDFGTAADGRLFCVMELLEGETLEERLTRETKIDWKSALTIASKALRALAVAHGANIVHRDIKPANIFLTKTGDVKLLDFGLAKAMTDEVPVGLPDGEIGASSEAESGAPTAAKLEAPTEDSGDELTRRAGLTILGTPEYMAPEQASAGQGDPRSDVYAMGCVVYEMITGSLPFAGTSAVAVLAAKIKGSPERPSERCPAASIPKNVDDLVLKALARHAVVRFQTALDMRKAITEALEAPLAKKAQRRVVGLATFAAVMAFAFVLVAGRAGDMRRALSGWAGSGKAASAEITADTPSAPASLNVAAQAPSPPAVAVVPIELEPVNITAERSPSGSVSVASASLEEEDDDPVAEGGVVGGEGDDGSAGSSSADANKNAAHTLLPIEQKHARARRRAHNADTADRDATASKEGAPKAHRGAHAKGASGSKSSKSASNDAGPVKGERSASHDDEPDDPPPSTSKAGSDGAPAGGVHRANKSASAAKSTPRSPRRKKKTRLAHNGE